MTSPRSGSTAKRKGHYLGTNREIADKRIAYCTLALERARGGIGGNVAVCEKNLNNWLEYRHRCQRDGTLDDGAWL